MSRRFPHLNAGALVFALVLLGLWQILAETRVLSPIFFPSPLRTLEELGREIMAGTLWPLFGGTALRMFYGWALASFLGIVLGAAIGSSARARDYLGPILEFMQPLPASAIIPAAILFLGLSNQMAVTVIAFGAIWPVLLATTHGFAATGRQLLDVATVLQLTPTQSLFKITLPGALPDILSGARVGLAIALILTVVTEMQASLPGLGQNIMLAQRSFRSPELYAGIIVLGLIGFVVNRALLAVEARVLRWRTVAA